MASGPHAAGISMKTFSRAGLHPESVLSLAVDVLLRPAIPGQGFGKFSAIRATIRRSRGWRVSRKVKWFKRFISRITERKRELALYGGGCFTAASPEPWDPDGFRREAS